MPENAILLQSLPSQPDTDSQGFRQGWEAGGDGVQSPESSTHPDEGSEVNQDTSCGYCSEVNQDTSCGYCGLNPRPLQHCNNPKAALFWIGLCAFLQGFVVNGINNVNVTSIERRFELTSTKVGWISSMYDLSAGILALPITYYGTYGHQPRIIAVTVLIMALGSFIMALPHFTTGLYELGTNTADTCDTTVSNSTICDGDSSGLSNYLPIFLLGQSLHGIGGTTIFTLGIVYIDSNVNPSASPLYQSIIFTCASVGPAVGFLVGGYMLELYVDFLSVDTNQLNILSSDARWVGAWWLAFLISACLCLIAVIGLWPFPRETPAGIKTRRVRKSEAHQNGSEEKCSKDDFMKSWRHIPLALKLLITNPVLMFTTLASITEGLILVGFATFMPKILQNQFYQTASKGALLTGFISVPGAAIGNILGGIVVKYFKLKVRGQLRLCVGTCILHLFLAFISLVHCNGANIAGIRMPYLPPGESAESALNLIVECNSDCRCDTWSYEPVCGVDGIQYFSSCHAGCTGVITNYTSDLEEKMYVNCSCISGPSEQDGVAAYEGSCLQSCDLMVTFLGVFFLIIVAVFFVYVPTYNISLRCIPHKQRPFGLGIQSVFTRILGTVFGPLVFGFAFDSACVTWQERCGIRGSCWIYDNAKLSINLLIVSLVIKVASSVFYALALWYYQPPKEEKLVFPNMPKATNSGN